MLGSSKNTTLAGIGAILIALGTLAVALFDGDPATVPNWSAIVGEIILGVGLIFAKDKNVTNSQNPGPPQVVQPK